MKHQIVYLPPYSPQLNPIENVFSKLQSFINNNMDSINNDDQLVECIHKAIASVSIHDCYQFYLHVIKKYYIECVNMKPLI